MHPGEVLDRGPGDGHRWETKNGQSEEYRKQRSAPMRRQILAAATSLRGRGPDPDVAGSMDSRRLLLRLGAEPRGKEGEGE
jgi:hypothetical protein